jgi:hypothetical protein
MIEKLLRAMEEHDASRVEVIVDAILAEFVKNSLGGAAYWTAAQRFVDRWHKSRAVCDGMCPICGYPAQALPRMYDGDFQCGGCGLRFSYDSRGLVHRWFEQKES